MDWLTGKHELPLGFGEHALANQVSGSNSGCTLDVIIEAIDRHGELVGVEGKLPLFVEVLIDELAQRIDGCTRRLERDRLDSSARAPGREPRDLDRNQGQQAAHRDTKPSAREKRLLV